jgi:hypothetical protein
MRLPFPSLGGNGAQESLNRLVAERAQQEAFLNRLSAQRLLLHGSGFNLFPFNDGRVGASFNHQAGPHEIQLPPGGVLSLLGSNRALPTGEFGPSGLVHRVGASNLGRTDASIAPGNQMNISRDFLQQLTSAQLQQLLSDKSSFGTNSATNQGQGN